MIISKIKPISLPYFAAILSAVNLVLFNIPFMAFIWQHLDMPSFPALCLMIAVTIVFLALHFMAFYLLLQLLRYVGRVIIALLFFLNGTCVYFICVYHTMMDESMMANVFNTRTSEASAFMTPSLFIGVALLGLLPMLYVLLRKVQPASWKVFGYSCGGSLLISALLVVININQVLWVGEYDTELGGLVMPWSYVVNTGLHFSHQAEANKEEIPLPDGKITNNGKNAVVLVIGESARKANFQLYGYERPTNPRLTQQEELIVLNARSNATYTTAGVKSILEHTETGDLYEVLPNYLYRMGVDVSWRTSNWGEPPLHIDEYLTKSELVEHYGIEYTAYDDILFHGIKQRIIESDKNKVLIILHTSTSHGPDYQRQYPEEFAHFLPVCTSVEKAEKERDRLINAYDNTILFTDACLSNLIDTLRTISDWKCAMLYVSDHGESLGENNLFMHGVPMRIAPKEQYEIPFLMWLSKDYRVVKEQNDMVDQHNVFHSVLNLLSVDSPVYNAEKDLFVRAE
ncbi:MAG: sulfatase-like hydrolase/transferase [Paludibacteraceae bacterium]|nr:sulfatase-like hydrolase/transferase [Paludibacteraceae bacterium]